jgi:hypothetical protein
MPDLLTSAIDISRAVYNYFGGGDQTVWESVKTAINNGVNAASMGGGVEIATGESTITTATATAAPIAGTSVVVPASTRPTLIHFGGGIGSSVAGDTVYLTLRKNSVNHRTLWNGAALVNGITMVAGVARIPASASDATFDLIIGRLAGTGNAKAFGDPTYPIYLTAVGA